MRRSSIFELAMVNWRIVVTFIAALVLYGVVALWTMPRQEFPQFTIRQGLVVGVMPGATSEEVEAQLTRTVEEYLFTYQEVDKSKTYSLSKNGQMYVFVELRANVGTQEADAFWSTLRHGLSELKAQRLPPTVLALVGNNDFGDTSAVLLTLTANDRSPRDLEEYLDIVERNLREIAGTSKLRRFGLQREVIRIAVSWDQLARYAIRPATLWATLQGLGGAPASARLDLDEVEIPVHVQRVLRSEQELADTVVLAEPGGASVRLRDVATITREYGHDDSYVRFNGTTAVVLSVEMQPGFDITSFGSQVDLALGRALQELPKDVQLTRIADQPEVVRRSVNHFLRDFGLAIASVILVTILLLPFRIASVAAITIPVCVFITLGLLNVLGVELHTVSLAGLIIVLGMVVDNAIVVIDDHVERLDHGMGVWEAAWTSARALTVPVLTATLAITMAYVPMALILDGMAGDFIATLPITIAVALGVSLALAVTLVPIMNARFVRRGVRAADGPRRWSLLDQLQHAFDRALELAFRVPWLVLGVGVASVALGVYLLSGIPQQTFPKVERNQFAVEVYLPNGRSIADTDALVRQLEAELLADKRIVNVSAFVGSSSPRFHTVYAPNLPSRHFAQLVVNTTTADAAVEALTDLEQRFGGAFSRGWVRWKQLDMQLSRAPLEIRLKGENVADLKRTAEAIEARARTIPDVTWVRNDFEEPQQIIEVVPDPQACAQLGVSPAAMQAALALGLQGLPVGTIWERDYPVQVLLKADATQTSTFEGLRNQYVSSMFLGSAVPLELLARLQQGWEEGTLVHRNGVRTLTVRGDVRIGAIAAPAQAELERFVAQLELPTGVSAEWGGERESSKETFTPMQVSLAVSIVAIYLILLVQFGRNRPAILVMLTMPLSVLGAAAGLVAIGYPFGLTSFMGITSLLGIVVRNGIILVGYANELMANEGMSAREAGIAAGKRRMRPIYLTSMAAAIGVVPMVLSGSSLWGPLGTVTCFGLLVSMVLTLFVLPVAYWFVMSGVAPLRKSGSMPAAAVAGAGLAALLMLTPRSALGDTGEVRLSLRDAERRALDENAAVDIARLELRAAERQRKAARAAYLPTVSAGALGIVAKDPLAELDNPGGNLPVYDGNPANLPTANQFAYMPASQMVAPERALVFAVTALQPVYSGGRIRNANRLATTASKLSEAQLELARRNALAETEQKYWQIVTLAEKLETLDAYDRLLGNLEKEATDAVQNGLSTRNNLLKVQLQRRRVSVGRSQLQSGIDLAKADLAQHIGLPAGTPLTLTDELDVPRDPAPLGAYAKGAASRRKEIELLEGAAKVERLQMEMRRGEARPTIAVGATAFQIRPNGMDPMTNAVAFGGVNVPLTGFIQTRQEVAGYRERVEEAERRVSQTRRLLELEIANTWNKLSTSWSSVAVAEVAVEQAELNVAEETDRCRNGLGGLSDVLEAEVQRQEAREAQLEARAAYWLTRSAYLRAVGLEGDDVPRADSARMHP